jgi:predicted acylesterase/phospholipase RssA
MPKTALVLSAGGMFGAYQAGAYKAIAETDPPDLVVGASVGALNGWAIAGGCRPEDLIARWQHPSAGATLQLFPKNDWIDLCGRGWFDPAPLRAQAESLCLEYQPRIPFGVVIMEVPGFHPRLVQHPNVSPVHLQATCSIPLFLPSVRIEGKRYLDGGIYEKLPFWAALQMGATRIIAIDSLPKVGKWWLRAGVNLAHVFKRQRRYAPDLDLTIISPSETLGTQDDAVFWKRSNIDRWIDLGRRDAAAALARQTPADQAPANQTTLNSVLSP